MSSASAVAQSDLYSMGIILYEMFSGELPFDAPQPLEIAMLHMTEPPPPPRQFRPDLSPALEAVILKALAKEPQDRYPNGLALAEALAQALQTEPKRALPLPAADPAQLSLSERVAVSMVKRPLPPLPAVVSDPQPAPIAAQASASLLETQTSGQVKNAPTPAAPAPANLRLPIIIGVGIGLIFLVGLLLVALLGFWWLRRGQPDTTAGQPSPQATALVAGEAAPAIEDSDSIASTATPAETPVPVTSSEPVLPPATSTPSLEPQLIVDSQRDFSGSAGVWEYLSSPVDKNDFKPLKFEEREYGTCWYGRDYIRICQDSGHPGNNADIAWLWKSQLNGHIQVVVSARKIDRGGDGVTILAYHNLSAEPLQGLTLGGKDTEGVNQKVWFETDVAAGDALIFVMKKNRSVEYDHTAFQVQIYQK